MFSGLVLGVDGIEGGAALMARMREAKPWLFGRAGANSSSAGRAPVVVAGEGQDGYGDV